MSVYLGKTNFTLGMTTRKRGEYANNAVLNVCHGFDPTSGALVPVPDIGASLANLAHYSTTLDYTIKHGNNYYTFSDMLAGRFGSSRTQVQNIFGTMVPLSKPVVAGKQIIFPTDKGLFAYEPNGATGKTNVRQLSLMGPEDFVDNVRPTVANGSVTRTKLFLVNATYSVSHCTVTTIKCSKLSTAVDGIQIEPESKDEKFYARVTFSGLSSTQKTGWFIYDIKIENDTQSYVLASMFENNDVAQSGYEIAFLDSNGDDLAVMGVPRCTPVRDQWYRCASAFDFGDNDPQDVAYVEFRSANYWTNENATETKIKIGCMDFDPAFLTYNTDRESMRHQWRYIGNFLYTADVLETSSYHDILHRDKDNTKDSESSKNIINNADFEGFPTGWESTATGRLDDDGESNRAFDSAEKAMVNVNDSTDYMTRDGDDEFDYMHAFNGHDSSKVTGVRKQLVTVEPFSFYSASVRYILNKRGAHDINYISLSLMFGGKSTEEDETCRYGAESGIPFTEYSRPGYNDEYRVAKLHIDNFFTGNHTAVYFTTTSNADYISCYGPVMRLIQGKSFYITSRIMYTFTDADLFDHKKASPHNCYEYSYSFAGRNLNEHNTDGDAGTKIDNYSLMVSNPSDVSIRVADDPFTRPTISATLPTISINNTNYNVIQLYGDYITHVLFYRSSVNGASGAGSDFDYRGKVAISSSVSLTDDKGSDLDEDDYRVDNYHYVPEEQEYDNDYLKYAKYVLYQGKRIFAGNLEDMPTAVAVSSYNKLWAFPTSVDTDSSIDTGSQLDNIHNISSEVKALASCRDAVIVFYDKEIVRIYGNDFYSNNGYSTNTIARLNSIYGTIANTINEVVFSDGHDWYVTQGTTVSNISQNKVDVNSINFTGRCSSLFYDNKYYCLVNGDKIYVFDTNYGSWYTIGCQNALELIEDFDTISCVTSEGKVCKLIGTTYSAYKRVVETMFHIIGDAQADAGVNDVVLEADVNGKSKVPFTFYTQGQHNEAQTRNIYLSPDRTRYNKEMRVNFKCVALKQKLEYQGDYPPTVYSMGLVRNDQKTQE